MLNKDNPSAFLKFIHLNVKASFISRASRTGTKKLAFVVLLDLGLIFLSSTKFKYSFNSQQAKLDI